MEIIEQFTAAKNGIQTSNEDVIVTTPNFIGIFDGTSLAKDETLKGMSGGRFAATTLAKIVRQLPRNIGAQAAVKMLTAKFNRAVKAAALADGLDLEKSRTAATMVLYSQAKQEIWNVGDSAFMIDGTATYNPIKLATLRAEVRQYLIHNELQGGKTEEDLLVDDPTPAFLAKTVMPGTKIYANGDDPVFGYGVMNGNPVPRQHVRVTSAKDAKEIVLASDGYPKLFNSLAQTQEYLAQVIAEDPLCYKTNPQAKGVMKGQTVYDDVSYIRFKI